MNYFEALIIAIIEGITEFLPISSTGHMIIASSFMKLNQLEFTKLYTVNIQFGAILSVLFLYWKRFFRNLEFYFKLFVAFLPAAFIGFFFGDEIDSLLENVMVVAITLLIGGIFLVFADKLFDENNLSNDESVSYKQAFSIGFFQCLALLPGVSRSGATIIGGMVNKLTKVRAAEFSFFLAVPTMFAASGYKLLKSYKMIGTEELKMLAFGNIIAFIVAMFAIKFLLKVLQSSGFKIFGYYRIALGLVILILIFMGYDLNIPQ